MKTSSSHNILHTLSQQHAELFHDTNIQQFLPIVLLKQSVISIDICTYCVAAILMHPRTFKMKIDPEKNQFLLLQKVHTEQFIKVCLL